MSLTLDVVINQLCDGVTSLRNTPDYCGFFLFRLLFDRTYVKIKSVTLRVLNNRGLRARTGTNSLNCSMSYSLKFFSGSLAGPLDVQLNFRGFIQLHSWDHSATPQYEKFHIVLFCIISLCSSCSVGRFLPIFTSILKL